MSFTANLFLLIFHLDDRSADLRGAKLYYDSLTITVNISLYFCFYFHYAFKRSYVAYMDIYKYVTSPVGLMPLLLKHFNISCKANLAVMNSSFCFSGKLFLSPSIVNDNLAG